MCWLLLLCRGQAWHGEWMAVPPCSVILRDPPHFSSCRWRFARILSRRAANISSAMVRRDFLADLSSLMSSAYLSAHPRTNHEQPTRFQQGGSQGNTCRVCSWSLGVGACAFRGRCEPYKILIILLLIEVLCIPRKDREI